MHHTGSIGHPPHALNLRHFQPKCIASKDPLVDVLKRPMMIGNGASSASLETTPPRPHAAPLADQLTDKEEEAPEKMPECEKTAADDQVQRMETHMKLAR